MTAPSPLLAPRPAGLVLPFAAIGLAGSTLVANQLFGPTFDSAWDCAGFAVVVSVTAACALLGRLVRRPIAQSSVLSAFVLCAAASFFGVLGGGAAGLLTSLIAPTFDSQSFDRVWLVPAGAVLGFWLAPSFWVPLLAVYFTRVGTGAARRGSFLARSEEARTWVVTAATIAAGSTIAIPMHHALHGAIIAAAATAALGTLTVAETVRLRAMLLVVRDVARIAEPHEVPADTEVDLGIGEERWVTRLLEHATYRGVARSERGVRGSIAVAQWKLTKAVMVDAGLFGASVVLLVVMSMRLPNR